MKGILSAEELFTTIRPYQPIGIKPKNEPPSAMDCINLISSRDAAIIKRIKDFSSEYFVCSLNMGYTDFLAELDSVLSDLNG